MPRKRNELVEFTVRGKFPFPLDMLRHDVCWPKSSDDVVRIDESLRQYEIPSSDRAGPWDITLQSKGTGVPTTGRWKSFGWEVTEFK